MNKKNYVILAAVDILATEHSTCCLKIAKSSCAI